MVKKGGIGLMSAILSTFSCLTLAQVDSDDLIGIWQCGPYEMRSGDMTIVTQEKKTFRKNGRYTEVATSMVSFVGQGRTTMTMQLDGRWQLDDDMLTMNFDKTTFLSSDNPQYSVAMGQKQADQQMAKKNWAKHEVELVGDKMIYIPVEAMYQEAKVIVYCTNPVNGSGLE